MSFARREPRWAVFFTVLVALVLQVIPLWDWLSMLRPSFIGLVIIYWSIFAPHAGGIFAPWLAGLALDVFKGDVLAQNALAMALIAYITMTLHQRLRNQTLVQQSIFVCLMLYSAEIVVWGIEGWTENVASTHWRWIQPMIGAMLWPFVAMLLSRTHTRSIS
jgi:rod shape-determining protein MreD